MLAYVVHSCTMDLSTKGSTPKEAHKMRPQTEADIFYTYEMGHATASELAAKYGVEVEDIFRVIDYYRKHFEY